MFLVMPRLVIIAFSLGQMRTIVDVISKLFQKTHDWMRMHDSMRPNESESSNSHQFYNVFKILADLNSWRVHALKLPSFH